MGIFKDLFSSKENSEKTFWKLIRSKEDIEAAKTESFEKKVAIFKHSTSCFISKTVLRNFENEVANSQADVSFYFLDLLKHRDLSNQIAEEFNVTHQSPQLIVIKDGKAIKDFSHEGISLEYI